MGGQCLTQVVRGRNSGELVTGSWGERRLSCVVRVSRPETVTQIADDDVLPDLCKSAG